MTDREPGDAICVKFALTAAEYGAAVRRLSWSFARFKFFAAWVVVMLVYGLAVLLVSDVVYLGHIPTVNAVVGITALAVGLLLGLSMVSTLYLNPGRDYRREAALRSEQRLCFSDREITQSALHGESRVQWAFFQRAIETPEVYLLRYRRRFGVILPKRAFATSSDEARFRDLVREHLPVKFRQARRQGEGGRGRTPSSSNP